MSKPFKGTINVDIRDSQPDWEPFEPPRAPDGAPNVVYIDKVGEGQIKTQPGKLMIDGEGLCIGRDGRAAVTTTTLASSHALSPAAWRGDRHINRSYRLPLRGAAQCARVRAAT
jgi:hypothetical protein